MTRLVQLTASNFKRLEAVHIAPDGNVVEISGRNGAGKSSCLDAIACALGGKTLCPKDPIKAGEKEASVEVELSNGWTVRRTFKRQTGGGCTSTIKVLLPEPDGRELSKPQSRLDAMLGALSFDPLAFIRMKPDEQVKMLCEVVGYDLDAYQRKRDEIFKKRTEVNRDGKRAAAALENIPHEIRRLSEPPEVPDADALLEQLNAANTYNTNRARAVQMLEERVERAKALKAELAKVESEINQIQERLDGNQPRDTSAIEEEIRKARRSQAARAEWQRAWELDKERRECAAESGALTEKLEELERERDRAMGKARVPGLESVTYDGTQILLGEFPLSQASQAEQIRAAVALGLAGKPDLRIILVREGSLLDADSMQLLRDLAEEHEAQVFVERVGAGDRGILIEDGRVA